jgi:hypothetical protein
VPKRWLTEYASSPPTAPPASPTTSSTAPDIRSTSPLPFLAPELLGAIKRRNGYPVLRPGLESSVPGLHIVGAPAAWSFGPIMRFVSGSWYASRAVRDAAAGHRRSRPLLDPVSPESR